MVRRAGAIVAAAVVIAALAGCVPAPQTPRPATAEEIEALRAEETRNWWNAIGDGAPMPEVEVIEELPPEAAHERQTECLLDAELPGVSANTQGGWDYVSEEGALTGMSTVVEQQLWVCYQQFPIANHGTGVLSASELAWLYDFYDNRYQPCLASVGYTLAEFPRREQFVGDGAGYPGWIPHDFSVTPTPTPAEWEFLALRCPLPTLLDSYQLPGSVASG